MGRLVDFIGLGAQRSGTSWIYACLFEHPGICIPVKEVNFFSRERNWSKGQAWYQGIFDGCPAEARVGEYSTSYLSDEETPARIHGLYPHAKLLVSLRNPVARAHSSYMNDIMTGIVDPGQPFSEALKEQEKYVQQGCYATQLERYLRYFPYDRMLVMIYEDTVRDPAGAMQRIFRFLEVEAAFVPSMLHRKVNEGRVPRSVPLDRLLRNTSDSFRRYGLQRIWWFLKRAGVGAGIRALNTAGATPDRSGLDQGSKQSLYELFHDEIRGVERILGRELREWRP